MRTLARSIFGRPQPRVSVHSFLGNCFCSNSTRLITSLSEVVSLLTRTRCHVRLPGKLLGRLMEHAQLRKCASALLATVELLQMTVVISRLDAEFCPSRSS